MSLNVAESQFSYLSSEKGGLMIHIYFLLSYETPEGKDFIFASLYPQDLGQRLAQSRCSVSAFWRNSPVWVTWCAVVRRTGSISPESRMNWFEKKMAFKLSLSLCWYNPCSWDCSSQKVLPGHQPAALTCSWNLPSRTLNHRPTHHCHCWFVWLSFHFLFLLIRQRQLSFSLYWDLTPCFMFSIVQWIGVWVGR